MYIYVYIYEYGGLARRRHAERATDDCNATAGGPVPLTDRPHLSWPSVRSYSRACAAAAPSSARRWAAAAPRRWPTSHGCGMPSRRRRRHPRPLPPLAHASFSSLVSLLDTCLVIDQTCCRHLRRDLGPTRPPLLQEQKGSPRPRLRQDLGSPPVSVAGLVGLNPRPRLRRNRFGLTPQCFRPGRPAGKARAGGTAGEARRIGAGRGDRRSAGRAP